MLDHGANIEHKNNKGLNSLMLAATLDLDKIVEVLLNNNANIESQSTLTKDTSLSLACSLGCYNV